MKYQFCVMVLALSLVSCQPKALPTVFEQKEGYALMKVSHETTKEELIQISEKLKIQKISIDFSASTFFENNRLQNLKLVVTTPNGNKGSCYADQTTLQFKYFGFVFNLHGQPAFKIGEL